MNKNVLFKTKCYLSGAMQYASNGQEWRNVVKNRLASRNITFFDPYHKPFVTECSENEEGKEEMLHWMETEQYDLVHRRMKTVRGYDLRLVDLSDWFICFIFPQLASWGTAEELSLIVREQKPVFIIIADQNGKKRTPLWIMSMVDHKYIYNSLEDAIETIEAIDDGIIKCNSNKWRLLLPELR